MSAAYFAKEVPTTPVRLSNGSTVKFEDVDGRTGVYKSASDFIVSELRLAVAQGRGGVYEIDEPAFLEFLKKKQPSQPKWRDEIRAGYAQDSLMPRVAPVGNQGPSGSPATQQVTPEVTPQVAPSKPVAQPLTVSDAPKPKAGKLKKSATSLTSIK